MDCPRLVLPTPGGPDEAEDRLAGHAVGGGLGLGVGGRRLDAAVFHPSYDLAPGAPDAAS